ncbi:MAG: hypothetical protein Q8R88_09530 [Desulfoprunum sp.]|nr:hypothetical protein [Desulfoprunum sp.]
MDEKRVYVIVVGAVFSNRCTAEDAVSAREFISTLNFEEIVYVFVIFIGKENAPGSIRLDAFCFQLETTSCSQTNIGFEIALQSVLCLFFTGLQAGAAGCGGRSGAPSFSCRPEFQTDTAAQEYPPD